jgi:hypothetical protein
MFFGCCDSSDPCPTGCAQENLYPLTYRSGLYGSFPDADCGLGSNFYSSGLNEAAFLGCCKSNPLFSSPPNCPLKDLAPSFITRPEQLAYFGESGNATALETSPVVLAPALLTQLVYHPATSTVQHSVAVTSGVISIATIVVVCIALAVWLCWRQFLPHFPEREQSATR